MSLYPHTEVVRWSILNCSSVHLNCIIWTLDMTLSVATCIEQTPMEWLSR